KNGINQRVDGATRAATNRRALGSAASVTSLQKKNLSTDYAELRRLLSVPTVSVLFFCENLSNLWMHLLHRERWTTSFTQLTRDSRIAPQLRKCCSWLAS